MSARKDDSQKPRLDLLPSSALLEIAKVLDHGATKYGENNWRAGLKWSRLLGACLRHVFAFLGGQNQDPETGLNHLAHACCCLLFLLDYQISHPEMDDRYIQGPKIGGVVITGSPTLPF